MLEHTIDAESIEPGMCLCGLEYQVIRAKGGDHIMHKKPPCSDYVELSGPAYLARVGHVVPPPPAPPVMNRAQRRRAARAARRRR